jgi:hypothetical protein
MRLLGIDTRTELREQAESVLAEAHCILDRKIIGIDCTQEESCILMRALDICGDELALEILDRFPLEGDQWWGHVEKGEADHVNPRPWGPEPRAAALARHAADTQQRIERNLA